MIYKVRTRKPELCIILCSYCLEWADSLRKDPKLTVEYSLDSCEVCAGKFLDTEAN